MPSQISRSPDLGSKSCHGFVLLEVLIAMSMILGVWMTSLGAYQRLVLSFAQQEAKKSQLRKEFDDFETQEQARAYLQLSNQGVSNESARVSSRNRAVRITTQSTLKNKR